MLRWTDLPMEVCFGKTIELNTKLVELAEEVPVYTVMISYSRRRFLGEYRFDIETNSEVGKSVKAHSAILIRAHNVAGHASLL